MKVCVVTYGWDDCDNGAESMLGLYANAELARKALDELRKTLDPDFIYITEQPVLTEEEAK